MKFPLAAALHGALSLGLRRALAPAVCAIALLLFAQGPLAGPRPSSLDDAQWHAVLGARQADSFALLLALLVAAQALGHLASFGRWQAGELLVRASSPAPSAVLGLGDFAGHLVPLGAALAVWSAVSIAGGEAPPWRAEAVLAAPALVLSSGESVERLELELRGAPDSARRLAIELFTLPGERAVAPLAATVRPAEAAPPADPGDPRAADPPAHRVQALVHGRTVLRVAVPGGASRIQLELARTEPGAPIGLGRNGLVLERPDRSPWRTPTALWAHGTLLLAASALVSLWVGRRARPIPAALLGPAVCLALLALVPLGPGAELSGALAALREGRGPSFPSAPSGAAVLAAVLLSALWAKATPRGARQR